MNDSKALFDYWHDQVRLRNHDQIAAAGHVETFKLRHNCTNYDELRQSREVEWLDELERSKVIAIIKYECTAQVLQYRAGRLRDRADALSNSVQTLDQQQSKLIRIIQTLQQKLFGKDQELKRLEARIAALETENEALRAESENDKAYAELLVEFERLQKEFERVQKRRQELAQNNQSLGGRVAHTKRFRRERDEARALVQEQKRQIAALTAENQQLREKLANLQAPMSFLKTESNP